MNVIIYTTQVCPWCHKAKEFLQAHKVLYRKIDVGTNARAAQEMIKKSGQQGVPVIEIGKEIIVGFDEKKLKKALKLP